jgi:glycosyltransferase involved in cell wall biosynthesis
MSPITDQPLVSIITPSFNQAAFISAAIESVLAQDYPNIEYIVVDGGSADGTPDILRGYGERVRWISEPDGGQSEAINKGVRMSSGAILAWLNADDLYMPQAVSRAVAALQADPQAAFVYGQARFIDRDGREIAPCVQVEPFNLDRLINEQDFIVQPATFMRRDAFLAVGGLDAGLRYCLDYDLWIKLGLQFSACYLPAILAQVRVYPETKTASGGIERMREIERMIRRYGRPRLPRLFYGEMIRTSWRAGLGALTAGKWTRALSCWRQSAFYSFAFAFRKASARLKGM